MLLEEPTTLDKTEIHDVLSNNRRCLVIEKLSEEGPTTLRDLANDIAAIETGETPPPRSARQSVYVTLHQSHMPKLDRLDIVDYDDVSKQVELGRRAKELRVYLEVVERGEISFSEYQLGIAVLGLVSTLAAAIGVPVLAALPPVAYATGAIVLLTFALSHQIYRQSSPLMDTFREWWGGDGEWGY